MKLLLITVTLACALAAPQHEPVGIYYHETVGIQEAARIKAAEEAQDFDGSRIVGGALAHVGDFPHLGGLLITLFSGATSVCGSSLLTHTKLVTAAHCWFDGRNFARQFTVVLGSTRLFFGGVRIATNRVEIHAHYDPVTLNNDIAIITVGWVGYTANINRIALATGSNQYAGLNAVAAGFGRTFDGAPISQAQSMGHVTMPVISNWECQRVFGSNVVIHSTICTNTAGGRSICGGDSGGPLAIGNTLIGVSTFVARTGCSLGFPAGFARVTSFAPWIQARL